jgi:hypothetical protein
MPYSVSWGSKQRPFTLTSLTAVEAVEIYVLFQATGPDEIIIAHCHDGPMDLAALRAAAFAEVEARAVVPPAAQSPPVSLSTWRDRLQRRFHG